MNEAQPKPEKNVNRQLTTSAIFTKSTGREAQSRSSTSAQDQTERAKAGAPSFPNLQLILEGPAAVCMAPPGLPAKIMIFMPDAMGHFNPGFDADTNETLLPAGDYTLDLGQRTVGNATIPGPDPNFVFDVVKTNCQLASASYLSVLVDRPDQIIHLNVTEAKIKDQNASVKFEKYVSRTLLYYQNVDPAEINVNPTGIGTTKVGSEVRHLFVRAFDGSTDDVVVQFAWLPEFVQLGCDNRLYLSRMASEVDNDKHEHATHAYMAVCKMLGISRSIEFKPPASLGPHNDCRAPQLFLTPLQ